MKRALITGSEGFAGGHLWNELEKNGYEVFGTTIHDIEKGMEKKVYHCDITIKDDLNALINNLLPEYIFHLAAVAAPAFSFKHPRVTFEVNTIGTTNLLDVIRDIPNYNPRILLVGTAEEYGVVASEDMPVTEEHQLNPISPYSVSKTANYFMSKIYVRAYNMDIVYAVSFNNAGPGQMTGFLPPDVANQIVDIERGNQKPILFTGNLDTYRDYTDVRDIVRAYRLLLEKGDAGERYNICSGKSVPTKFIVDTLIKNSTMSIEREIDQKRNRPSDMPILEGSNKKLKSLTDWEPEIDLQDTLKDLLEWYRNKE